MRKTKSRVFLENTLFTIAILFSLTLISYPYIKKLIIYEASNTYQINNVKKETIETNKNIEANYDWSQATSIDLQTLLELYKSKSSLPVIGGITVPELGINLPVFNGTSNEAMSFGSGTLTEEQIMGEGNYSLASHHIFGASEDLLFTPLKNAKIGQKIYLTDKTKVFEYTISDIFIVNPDQVDVIDDIPGKKVITLITCTDLEATQRIIVRGELSNTYDYEEMPIEAIEGFKKEYKIFDQII